MVEEIKFKKFHDYILEKEDVELEKLVRETFNSLDEGFLANIQSLGFFKALKLSLGKGIMSIMDIIKANPKVQKDLSNFMGNIGQSASKDFGDIMGNIVGPLQQENDELKKQLEMVRGRKK
jgi:hypothetical protein